MVHPCSCFLGASLSLARQRADQAPVLSRPELLLPATDDLTGRGQAAVLFRTLTLFSRMP